MNKEIELNYASICRDVFNSQIKSALDTLALISRLANKSEYFYELESLNENYRSLLKYAFEGYSDPQREQILKGIAASILSLADEIRFSSREKERVQQRLEKSLLIREFGEDPSVTLSKFEEVLVSRDVKKIAEETGTTISSVKPLEGIFKFIWLTGKIKDHHIDLVRKIIRSETVEWHEKSIIVSALTLSLLNYFDPRKLLLLAEFIEQREKHVYHRALVGLLIGLIIYDRRITFYPEVNAKLFELSGDTGFIKDVEAILLQLLMAGETEKITREFEEEVLPEMKKMLPKIEDKLQLGNLFEEEDMEGKNPGWQGMIEEVPGLFERIEKFSRMQMEGADVFMSTFSMLKRFDFFNRMSNWFVPFYTDNPELEPDPGEGQEFSKRLLESLERAFYICNSDKYSFALNFKAVPIQQRSMIVTHFEAELEQMKEMISEEEILGQTISSNAIFTQYIQDLYRFFKLYPSHNEFDDIFLVKIHFSELLFFKTFFERESFTERLATFYFENGHYPEAIEIYQYISRNKEPKAEHFEKIAFAYQKLRRYKEAIQYYKKADLFDQNRLWVLKKLGWCHLKLKDHEHALPYFEEAARLQPDDLNLQAQIGQCHLSLKQFDEALQHYSKVRYFQPENLKVLRPIAYCHFVLGKLDEAVDLYAELLSSGSPTPFDLMNAAHVYLCLGKKREALEYYMQSFSDKTLSDETFLAAFEEDIPYLIQNGIRREDIPLITDYVMFQH